ncbi:MAG: putative two component transcriptional regulator, winged helix family [Parcubacteria group bacterium Gr01-1014_31]|nr:MAG: putative two component transcriptional regulator, winged helix family [Parcubacteria group bacterium Gr01-1014_31]
MPTSAKKVVLLVEDDEFLAELYATKLNLEGYEVLSAADGKKGLKLAQDKHPALVLLDIILPKLDGFEVLKGLKEDPTTKDIPVILLTNLSQKDEVKRGLDLGAADYLIKAHFMPSEVVKKIKALVQ